MLTIHNLHAGYGKVQVLHGISIEVPRGQVAQAHEAQQRVCARRAPVALAPVARRVQRHVDEVAVERVMQADKHVLLRRHLAEQLHVLEGARNAAQGDVRWRPAVHRTAGKSDLPAGRHVDAGQHIHHRALA